MPRRYFTVEQANRTLPLVTRIVADLTASYERLRQRQGQLSKVEESQRQNQANVVHRLERELERLLAELEMIGCELKDVERGLLDFYARHGEREILLCWMKGEDEIGYWHELETGFRGRRPVAELPAETLRAPDSV